MHMKHRYSTAEVAAEVGVAKTTLLRWLYSGKVQEPRKETFGGVSSRVWTEADLRLVREYREERYRKRS